MAKIPLAPFEKLLKESKKDIRVSDSATRKFVEQISELAREIAADAAEFAEHAGRRTILDSDVKLAGKRSGR